MDVFKDKELQDAFDDLARSLSVVRISSIDRDPGAFIRLSERMGALNAMLVRKLAVRQQKVLTKPQGVPTDICTCGHQRDRHNSEGRCCSPIDCRTESGNCNQFTEKTICVSSPSQTPTDSTTS